MNMQIDTTEIARQIDRWIDGWVERQIEIDVQYTYRPHTLIDNIGMKINRFYIFSKLRNRQLQFISKNLIGY